MFTPGLFLYNVARRGGGIGRTYTRRCGMRMKMLSMGSSNRFLRAHTAQRVALDRRERTRL